MQPISAVIITYNEETNIERCILSVRRVADEVVVVDSFSSDRTVEIAERLGAVVYQEKFRGYIGQKNMAMQLASHHYILSLDADEALDEELAAAIIREKESLLARAYSMNRCTQYCGRFLRHGLWYPDRKIRLFDRRIARWGGLNPHDRIELSPAFPVKHLQGDILHYAFETVEDLVWRNNRISSIAASSYYSVGRKSNWLRMLIHPAWAFVHGYFIKLGFLDGIEGFSFAIQSANQVFLKYNKLYRLRQAVRHRKTISPLARPFPPAQKNVSGEK